MIAAYKPQPVNQTVAPPDSEADERLMAEIIGYMNVWSWKTLHVAMISLIHGSKTEIYPHPQDRK